MRQIKFRAKRMDSNEWLFGSLFVDENEQCYIKEPNGKLYFIEDKDTIGQFTGLKDKNGREIYEGDIVKDLAEGFFTDRIGYIAFLSQECGFVIVWPKSDSRLGHRNRGGGYNCDTTLEVIGNIYDNKEPLIE